MRVEVSCGCRLEELLLALYHVGSGKGTQADLAVRIFTDEPLPW